MNPWLILGIVLAWIASLGTVGYWQRGEGERVERVGFQNQQIAELRMANDEIARLNKLARASEQMHSADLAQIGEDHAQQLADADALRRRDVAAATSGALRLRDPGAKPPACSGGVPSAPAAPANSDAPQAGELSREATAFLYEFADDADATADTLGKCQAVVINDRKPNADRHP